MLASLKNEVWKESAADFVVVSDFDEFIYAKDIVSEFRKMKEEGITVCKPLEYVMLGDNFPVYNENVLSHEQIKYGYQGNSKCLIFSSFIAFLKLPLIMIVMSLIVFSDSPPAPSFLPFLNRFKRKS